MENEPDSEGYISENLEVAVVHKNLQDVLLQKHSLRSAATLGRFTSIKEDVIKYSLAVAAARGTAQWTSIR